MSGKSDRTRRVKRLMWESKAAHKSIGKQYRRLSWRSELRTNRKRFAGCPSWFPQTTVIVIVIVVVLYLIWIGYTAAAAIGVVIMIGMASADIIHRLRIRPASA